MPAVDLTNQKFGRLTVIEKSPIRKSNRVTWRCRCECGNEVLVITNHLTSGHTRSCGCLHSEITSALHAKDLTRQRFGKLVALEKVQSRNNNAYWKCQCDCGNICEVRANSLTTGHTTSCGCINSKGEEAIAKWLLDNNINFERQKVFDDCRNPNTNCLLRFDFFINNKLLLEYDGITHYQASGGWNTESAVKNMQFNDNVKNEWSLAHNLPLVRITYNHIYSMDQLNTTLQNIMSVYNI